MFKKPLWQTVWSTLFASILNSSVMLGNYLQQTTSADDIFRCLFFLSALRVNWVTRPDNKVLPGLIVFMFTSLYFDVPVLKIYVIKNLISRQLTVCIMHVYISVMPTGNETAIREIFFLKPAS